MSSLVGGRHRVRVLLAAVCCISAALLAAESQAAPRPDLTNTPEWGRLAALWQTVLDHSSDVVYSPARFRELVKDIDGIDVDLAALVKRGYLPVSVSAGLRRVFHSRYSYILDRHYTSDSSVTMTGIESAVATSHWIVELQLAALRRAEAGTEVGRKTISGAESAIAYELSFLQEYEGFQEEADRRRKALADKQAAGEKVDFRPFEAERLKKTLRLMDAYWAKRIPISRSVRAMMPHVTSLTTLPAVSATTSSAAVPGG
jgi:hypothetical protein